jgi:hypothetical protein
LGEDELGGVRSGVDELEAEFTPALCVAAESEVVPGLELIGMLFVVDA